MPTRLLPPLLRSLMLLLGAIGLASGCRAAPTPPVAPPVGTIVRDCANCPELVVIPQVDRTAADPGRVLYVGRFEVTWHEYLASYRKAGCPIPDLTFGPGPWIPTPRELASIDDDYPVTLVSVDRFQCYLGWLSRKTGKRYRLPTGTEWTHFAHAGTATTYPWGDTFGYNNAAVAGYYDFEAFSRRHGPRRERMLTGSNEIHRTDVAIPLVYPVGTFPPNPWSLYDVIGNASEATTEPVPKSAVAGFRCLPQRRCAFVYGRGTVLEAPVTNGKLLQALPLPSLINTKRIIPTYAAAVGEGFRVVRD